MQTSLKLVVVTLEHLNQIINYKEEFIKNDESIHGAVGLKKADCVKDWIKELNNYENRIKAKLVPSTTFAALRLSDDKLIGIVDIRHYLNDYLLKFGGHIGYSVCKSERGKGYATEMLSLALLECKKLRINKVLITCNKDNVASAKTIIKNHGHLENEVTEDDGTIVERYWIYCI